MSHTLLAAQEEASTVTEASNAATEFLLEHCFIVATIATDVANQGEDQSNVLLSPTQLGKARRIALYMILYLIAGWQRRC